MITSDHQGRYNPLSRLLTGVAGGRGRFSRRPRLSLGGA
jgi:hypothetical protein